MKNWRLGLSLALGLALSLVLLCGTALAAEAASGSWPDYKLRPGYGGTWTLDSEGTLTFEGKGVIPPEEPNGWAEWLRYRDSVRKIVIGPGVTELTYHVFAEYKELQAVEIPESVTAILDGAFRGCVSLTSVTIPASVVSLSTPQEEGERVYHGAFGGCTGLREADIAARDIGPRAFTGCSSLSRVTLREGVETIGDDAFLNCGLEELTLPASLQDMGLRALYNNTYLNSIEVAAGSTAYQSINGVVFSRDGSGLTLCPPGKKGRFIIPEGTKTIAASAFISCGGLTGVDIPEGVVSIGDEAFMDCAALAEAALPQSVEAVGAHAFDGCSGLTRLELGRVESIGDRAFWGCGALSSVTLPDSLTSVGRAAFGDCTKLTSVVIPGSLKEVPGNMFTSCVNISSVTLEDGVQTVGESAFSTGSHLTLVVIPKSVTRIETGAFSGGNAKNMVVHYAGTEDEWNQIKTGARPFEDSAVILYGSVGPVKPVIQKVVKWNYVRKPERDRILLYLTPELDNIGPAGTVVVGAAIYKGGRMMDFQEAKLQVEPGLHSYPMDPLVFMTDEMEDSCKVFLLEDGGLVPLAKWG